MDRATEVALTVDQTSEGIRAGRRHVKHEVTALGGTAVAEDAALAAAELLANAVQHGSPPVAVQVSGDADRIRIEVQDGSRRPPVRPSSSGTNMTGRGIAMVDALATRWGVDPRPEGGKSVWAEFEAA